MSQESRFLVIAVALLGVAVGWFSRGAQLEQASPSEAHAAAQRQEDGSLVLERQATGSPVPAAPHALPAGSREEHRVQVVVQPRRGVIATPEHSSAVPDVPAAHVTTGDSLALDHLAGAGNVIDSCDCPPVTVDLSLVRMPDKTRRVVASSQDGVVLSGLDIPVESAPEEEPLRWTASALLQVDGDAVRPGLGLDWRPLERLQVGFEAYARKDLTRPGVGLRTGFNF